MYSLRRISGLSMLPTLQPDKVVVIKSFRNSYHIGEIIVFTHDGIEKIKRITAIRYRAGKPEIFVRGDNTASSSDSRTFGWLPMHVIIGKIVWVVPII